MEILKISQKTVCDKVLRDKPFNIAKNPKYDRCQRGLASVVYKFFDKRLLLQVQINLQVVVLQYYKMNN